MSDVPGPGGDPGTTHFGFREVPTAQKQKLVGEVFSSVAGKYDLMNDLMSLGIHRLWKRYFVATAQVSKGDRVLDLAGGTGDIAALLKDRVGDSGELVLGDINGDMLRVGRDRMIDRGNVRGFEYVQCNAEALPFPDASFNLVTIAFGQPLPRLGDGGVEQGAIVGLLQIRCFRHGEGSLGWPAHDRR